MLLYARHRLFDFLFTNSKNEKNIVFDGESAVLLWMALLFLRTMAAGN